METNQATSTQWRVCGDDSRRGSWSSVWRDKEPDYYDTQQLAKRNDRVWIERREVQYSPVERIEVDA